MIIDCLLKNGDDVNNIRTVARYLIRAHHLHHCQKSGTGRHDDGSGVYPNVLSLRRVNPAGDNARMDANAHVRIAPSLLYQYGIRDFSERHRSRYSLG